MINRRYWIVEKLGQGSGGEVFLVEDRLTGDQCALKIFSDHESSSLDSESLKQEFSVLTGLSHPNLVKVREYGRIEITDDPSLKGRTFFTMEYLRGKNALSFIQEASDASRRLELLETLLLQSLVAVDYIHRKGVIHFDLKPENLIVGEDGQGEITLKVTDFGLSSTIIDTNGLPIRGTLDYIAPEIVQGRQVDHRIDLYSLGATFFHLWEGRCPFHASSPMEMLRVLLCEPFPRLSRGDNRESIIPDLIEWMCRKDPDVRCPNARQALLRFASSKYDEDVRKRLFIDCTVPFVGRRSEVEVLQRTVREQIPIERAEGKALLLVGPAGLGKSSLLRAVESYARGLGRTVLNLDPSSPNSIKRIVEFVAALSDRQIPDTNQKSVEEEAEVLGRLFYDTSFSIPLVILVDDAHRLDELSLSTVRWLLGHSWGGRYLIIASTTDDREDECFPNTEGVHRVLMGELNRGEVMELVEQYFGDGIVPLSIVRQMYDRYGGIPAVVIDGLKALANALPLAILNDSDAFARLETSLVEFLSFRVEDYFASRFHRLRREKQIVLELISSFDVSPEVEWLRRLIPFQRNRLELFLGSLERERFILRDDRMQDPGVQTPRYRIRHLQLKEYISRSIREDQIDLHGFIAACLESTIALSDWMDVRELGRQNERASLPSKAAIFYELAGDLAMKAGETPTSADLFSYALRCKKDEDISRKMIVLHKQVDALLSSGLYREAIVLLEEVVRESPKDVIRQHRVHTSLGKAYARLGENSNALKELQTALEVAEDETDRFEIRQEIVSLQITEGRYDEAISTGEAQRVIARQSPNREMLALVETDLGIAQFCRGYFQEAIKSFEIACDIYRSSRNTSKVVDALNNIGNALSSIHDYRGALEKWNMALDLLSDAEAHYQRAQISNNIGIAHAKLGEFVEAKTHYSRARELSELVDSKSGVAFALTNLGEVAFAEGDYEQALVLWNRGLQMYEEMHDTAGMCQAHLQVAQVYAILGDWMRGHEHVRLGGKLMDSHRLVDCTGLHWFLKAEHLASCQRTDEAIEAYCRAEQAFGTIGSLSWGVDSEQDSKYRAVVRRAELLVRKAEYNDAVRLLTNVANGNGTSVARGVAAEAAFVLGMIARVDNQVLRERPLMYFRQAFELVEKEHILEISWKAARSLGEELVVRGQKERGQDLLDKAALIIHYFVSQFRTPQLRDQYLSVEGRSKVLSEVSQVIPTKE